MSAPDNPPAFPMAGDVTFNEGMTLRDYFAAKAMAAMIANPECVSNKSAVATHAYGYADEMLIARTPGGPTP